MHPLVRGVIIVAAGALGGAVMGLSLHQFIKQVNERAMTTGPLSKRPPVSTPTSAAPAPPPPVVYEGPAKTYAKNLQEGNWNAVVQQMLWMEERLRRVQLGGGDAEAVTKERQVLCDQVSERNVSGNQLLDEGIEDQYIFAPGAELEVARVDEGQSGLEQPVAERVWIRVTYASKTRAPRDPANLPIRSITVGINTDADGKVLKANLIGNLDIDWDSIVLEWPRNRGEQ